MDIPEETAVRVQGGDHLGVCRFSDAEDATYLLVVSDIEEAVAVPALALASAPSPGSSRQSWEREEEIREEDGREEDGREQDGREEDKDVWVMTEGGVWTLQKPGHATQSTERPMLKAPEAPPLPPLAAPGRDEVGGGGG
jgi:hypothetical protein